MKGTAFLDEQWNLKLGLLRLRVGLIALRRDLLRRRLRHPDRKYRPDQPRVPSGNADGGQWTDGTGGSGPMSFEEWLAGGWATDLSATEGAESEGRGDWRLRDDQAPIEDITYRPRGGSGQWPGATLGQQARLAASESQAQSAIRRVQEIDPRWKPPASMSEGIEGAILSNQAAIRQAEARLRELAGKGIGEGPFARESIPARGPGRLRESEQKQIDAIGRLFGCHSRGTTEPGTGSGRFIGDHQIPSALNPAGRTQRLFPHCLSCSLRQGGSVQSLRGRR
jgi:hypothetical protein